MVYVIMIHLMIMRIRTVQGNVLEQLKKTVQGNVVVMQLRMIVVFVEVIMQSWIVLVSVLATQ